MIHLAWLLPVFPFAACAVLLFWGSALTRRWGERVGWLGVAGIAATAPLAVGALLELTRGAAPSGGAVSWVPVGETVLYLGYRVDALTAVMVSMVAVVATCIQVSPWATCTATRGSAASSPTSASSAAQ